MWLYLLPSRWAQIRRRRAVEACSCADVASAIVINAAWVRVGLTFDHPAKEGRCPLPANGDWELSPNRLDVTFRELAFEDDARNQRWVPLTDCTASYDLAEPSLTALLDCPFEMPRGRYTNLRLKFDSDVAVTIDDPANGLWTDGVGLVTTEPEGGAVPTVISGQDTVRTTFSEELVVGDEPLELSIVVNAVHSIRASIVGDSVTLGGPVIQLHASPFGVGAAQFLSAGSSLGTRPGTDHRTELLLFFEGAETPVYAWLMPGEGLAPCGGAGEGFYQAYATTPGPYDENGGRVGGFLAQDPTGAICFALPEDHTWDRYSAVYRLDHVEAVGATTTLTCESTSTPPEPQSSKTWGAGCPTITPQGSETLTLAAN